MQFNLRQSCQLYNWQDNYAKNIKYQFKKKSQTISRSSKKYKTNYATWLSNRTVQEMWEIKLPLRRGEGTWPELLPFCQHAWIEACHDLYSCRIQTNSRRSFRELSRNSEIYRKNQQYKSRVDRKKGIFLGNILWDLKWTRPP